MGRGRDSTRRKIRENLYSGILLLDRALVQVAYADSLAAGRSPRFNKQIPMIFKLVDTAQKEIALLRRLI